jgi:glycosyltransferase involved in cell wall biosynthesis
MYETAGGITRQLVSEPNLSDLAVPFWIPHRMPIDFPPSIALVHDWLTGMRGGEKCLEVLCDLYPAAPIHTLIAFPERVSEVIRAHEIRTSFLQHLPMIEKRYRHYLPLFPRAIESFDMREFDLVVSSSHAVAKGVRIAPRTLHISYVHTPMRYVWDMFDQYFSKELVGSVQRAAIKIVAARLRRWDVASNARVHHFIANSAYVRDRIMRFYGRDAVVIHPPVETGRFRVSPDNDGYFLILSALVPYKRVDLAVLAFNELGLPLRVVGDGPEMERLRAMAAPNIRFDGAVSDADIDRAYAGCIALLFPGEEDFGIVPVEAMASGKPVIAYRKGGAMETVVDGLSGAFFDAQSTASLAAAVRRFRAQDFDPAAIRRHAEQFDRAVYREKMDTFVRERWDAWVRR